MFRREFVRSLGVVGIATGALTSTAAGTSEDEPASVDLDIYPEAEGKAPSTDIDASIELAAEQFSFDPSTIRVDEGDRVRIKLDSSDVVHGIYIDGYEIETKVYPDEPVIVELNAVKSGSFRFRCNVTCGSFHPFMIGRLVVSPNQRFMGSLVLTAFGGLGVIGGVWWRTRSSPGEPEKPVSESPGGEE